LNCAVALPSPGMSERLLDLATRRGMLQARIANQRQALSDNIWPLREGLRASDSVLSGVDWLKQHPAAVVAAVAAAVIARPKRIFRWGQRGFFLWRGWRAIKKTLNEIR
jgi:hypothetical protein